MILKNWDFHVRIDMGHGRKESVIFVVPLSTLVEIGATGVRVRVRVRHRAPRALAVTEQ